MRKLSIFAVAGLLAATAVAPTLADEAPRRHHRHHHYHHHWRALPYPIS
jgi:predicted exporter